MMNDREERSDRLKKRLERDKDETEVSTKDKQKESLKDRPSVLMYLPEDIHMELDVRFDELNAQYKRKTGKGLQKNRDYYPAVIKAGLEGKDIKDVLDL